MPQLHDLKQSKQMLSHCLIRPIEALRYQLKRGETGHMAKVKFRTRVKRRGSQVGTKLRTRTHAPWWIQASPPPLALVTLPAWRRGLHWECIPSPCKPGMQPFPVCCLIAYVLFARNTTCTTFLCLPPRWICAPPLCDSKWSDAGAGMGRVLGWERTLSAKMYSSHSVTIQHVPLRIHSSTDLRLSTPATPMVTCMLSVHAAHVRSRSRR